MGKTKELTKKNIIIRGRVLDDPIANQFGESIKNWFSAIFPMEFIESVEKSDKDSDVFLKTGQLIMVAYQNRSPTYIKANHEIELQGKLYLITEYDRNKAESLFFSAEKIFNETLQFSFDY